MSRHHDALFVLYCFRPPEEMEEVVGGILSGWVFSDTKQEGRHPFSDGKYIETSRVMEVVSEDDKLYIITRNTTYLYIGAARSPENAYNVFSQHEGTLRGPVSLTGDPVA